jgi:hypothetical protein
MAGKSSRGASLFGSSEAMKLLRDTSMGEAKISLEKRLSKMSSQVGHGASPVSMPGHPKHPGMLGGSSMSDVSLVPNKILMLSSQAQQAHSIHPGGNSKLGI